MQQILAYGRSGRYRIGVSPAAVGAVAAVGGDLQRLPIPNNRQSAMGHPGLHRAPAFVAKRLLHQGPRQIRGQIDIVNGSLQKRVAHAATHAPRLAPGLLQDTQGFTGNIGKGKCPPSDGSR